MEQVSFQCNLVHRLDRADKIEDIHRENAKGLNHYIQIVCLTLHLSPLRFKEEKRKDFSLKNKGRQCTLSGLALFYQYFVVNHPSVLEALKSVIICPSWLFWDQRGWRGGCGADKKWRSQAVSASELMISPQNNPLLLVLTSSPASIGAQRSTKRALGSVKGQVDLKIM